MEVVVVDPKIIELSQTDGQDPVPMSKDKSEEVNPVSQDQPEGQDPAPQNPTQQEEESVVSEEKNNNQEHPKLKENPRLIIMDHLTNVPTAANCQLLIHRVPTEFPMPLTPSNARERLNSSTTPWLVSVSNYTEGLWLAPPLWDK